MAIRTLKKRNNMCLYGRLILNRKYTATKKNSGVIPAICDNRTMYVPIGCGNCIECKLKKAREWRVRLMEDIRTNTNCKFVTLTFSDKSIAQLTEKIVTESICNKMPVKTGYELDNELATKAVRLWLERYRKEHKKSIRHWLVTELGHKGTENIHMHGIVWNVELKELEKHWQYGWVWKGKQYKGRTINYVNEQTINYTVKYVNKIDAKHKNYRSIVLTSSGIGKNYIKRVDAIKNKYKEGNTNEAYRTRNGTKLALPIYYRNKIYSEEEREKLWIEKLNKEERWVDGVKVDVSKGVDEYTKVLKEARKKNTRLGYGSNWKDEDAINYERQMRILKQMTRIKKGSAPQAPAGGG